MILVRALGSRHLLRLAPVLPGGVRRRLTPLAGRLITRVGGDALVEDWSAPLLPGGPPSGRAPMTRPHPAQLPVGAVPSAAERPAATARCLLATSDLDVGGLDEVVAFLARHLPRHGLRTAVLHTCAAGAEPTSPGRLGRALTEAGIEVVTLSEPRGRDWIRTWRPDVVSAHGAQPWVLDEAHALGLPYVDVLHGMHSHFGADWEVERRRARGLAAIVAVSELVRRQYLAGAPDFPEARIVTIPNGVDAERRQRMSRGSARAALGLGEEFLFVSLARYCLQKNTFALISAFAEVAKAHPDAHLLIAGRPDDPVYCARVRRLHRSLACRDRIHLRDHAADPGLVLSGADCFVLNSFFEGWALASMEALHAGLPVILSDVGGAREQIGDAAGRGYLVGNPLGDPLRVDWSSIRSASYAPQVNRSELVAAMRAALASRERWAARRDALAAESAERFRLEPCARAHAALLHGVADGSFPGGETAGAPGTSAARRLVVG